MGARLTGSDQSEAAKHPKSAQKTGTARFEGPEHFRLLSEAPQHFRQPLCGSAALPATSRWFRSTSGNLSVVPQHFRQPLGGSAALSVTSLRLRSNFGGVSKAPERFRLLSEALQHFRQPRYDFGGVSVRLDASAALSAPSMWALSFSGAILVFSGHFRPRLCSLRALPVGLSESLEDFLFCLVGCGGLPVAAPPLPVGRHEGPDAGAAPGPRRGLGLGGGGGGGAEAPPPPRPRPGPGPAGGGGAPLPAAPRRPPGDAAGAGPGHAPPPARAPSGAAAAPGRDPGTDARNPGGAQRAGAAPGRKPQKRRGQGQENPARGPGPAVFGAHRAPPAGPGSVPAAQPRPPAAPAPHRREPPGVGGGAGADAGVGPERDLRVQRAALGARRPRRPGRARAAAPGAAETRAGPARARGALPAAGRHRGGAGGAPGPRGASRAGLGGAPGQGAEPPGGGAEAPAGGAQEALRPRRLRLARRSRPGRHHRRLGGRGLSPLAAAAVDQRKPRPPPHPIGWNPARPPRSFPIGQFCRQSLQCGFSIGGWMRGFYWSVLLSITVIPARRGSYWLAVTSLGAAPLKHFAPEMAPKCRKKIKNKFLKNPQKSQKIPKNGNGSGLRPGIQKSPEMALKMSQKNSKHFLKNPKNPKKLKWVTAPPKIPKSQKKKKSSMLKNIFNFSFYFFLF